MFFQHFDESRNFLASLVIDNVQILFHRVVHLIVKELVESQAFLLGFLELFCDFYVFIKEGIRSGL